ncbi:MAG: hypothetical protein J6U71_05060 [Bacteroidales bacterium]|nr:hypothetical protein [Bacteroidales bacterium]
MKYLKTFAIIISFLCAIVSVTAQNRGRTVIQLDPNADTCRFSTPDSILHNEMGNREILLIFKSSEHKSKTHIRINNRQVVSKYKENSFNSYYCYDIASLINREGENILIHNPKKRNIDEMFIVITNNPYINYTQVEYECTDDGIDVTTSTIISGTNGKMFQLTAEIVNEDGSRAKTIPECRVKEMKNGDVEGIQNFRLSTYGTYQIIHTLYYIPALERDEEQKRGIQARKYLCEKFITTISVTAEEENRTLLNPIGTDYKVKKDNQRYRNRNRKGVSNINYLK